MSDSTSNTAASPEAGAVPLTADSALVVESDPAIRSLITFILRREAFEVEAVSDPDEALANFQRREYAVVVFDLPRHDPRALRLLELLQKRDPRTLRRVVIVTADVHVLRHGLPTDVCRVLKKPFEIGDLLAAVKTCAGEGGS